MWLKNEELCFIFGGLAKIVPKFFKFFCILQTTVDVFPKNFLYIPLLMIKIPHSRSLTKAFRHVLCEERKKRGTTQFELARKSGLTRQCISLLESGHRVPTFPSLFSLARGFDITFQKFMSLLLNKVEYYEHHERLPMAADGKKPRWRRAKT